MIVSMWSRVEIHLLIYTVSINIKDIKTDNCKLNFQQDFTLAI